MYAPGIRINFPFKIDGHGNVLKIVEGPFAGETVEYDPETGNQIHQNTIFVHNP